LIKGFPNNIKEIKATGESNVLLTRDEKLYEFRFNKDENRILDNSQKVFNIFRNINANKKINISNISCGKNFSILLTKQGILYSVGKNSHGELGLGNFKTRTEPEIIKEIIDLKEKINQVECGFKHVIAKTTTGKAYSWGNVKTFEIFYIF